MFLGFAHLPRNAAYYAMQISYHDHMLLENCQGHFSFRTPFEKAFAGYPQASKYFHAKLRKSMVECAAPRDKSPFCRKILVFLKISSAKLHACGNMTRESFLRHSMIN